MSIKLSFHHPDSFLGKESREAEERRESAKHKVEHFRVKHSDIHKVAEELRKEGKGSHDPHYNDSKKNK